MRDLLAAAEHVRRTGRSISIHCPSHDDQHPSCRVSRGNDGRILLKCYAGCSFESIVEAAGMTAADLAPSTDGHGHTTDRVTPYQIRTTDGRFIAIHERHDTARGKRFLWRQPDGTATLNGHAVKDLPLYGAHRLPRLPSETRVVLTEGERACDALQRHGIAAVGTVTGASGTPSDDVLRPLLARPVLLWPDNDTPGRVHMDRIAVRLATLGHQDIRVVDWVDAPPGGDAADYADDVQALLDAALPYYRSHHDQETQAPPNGPTITLTPASQIHIKPVQWLWYQRLPLGTLGLLGGREGIGKSVLSMQIVADTTRGRLPGIYAGTPKSVIIAAAEDSWEHTIVPRLMAADADLDRVYRIDVQTTAALSLSVSLPRDIPQLETLIHTRDVALVDFDPLISRLSHSIDSHKDAEVRSALEPLAGMADRTGAVILGLIHVNKTTSTDPLTLLMGSRAFAAVARFVLFVSLDPDDEQRRLVGEPKNNLGHTDLPTLAYRIDEALVAETGEGPVKTGRLQWDGELDRSIREVLEASAGTGADRSATHEAMDWLEDYLASQGGTADSAEAKRAGRNAGHTDRTLHRARHRLKVQVHSHEYPRRTFWTLPAQPCDAGRATAQGRGMTGTTGTTDEVSPISRASGANGASLQEDGTTVEEHVTEGAFDPRAAFPRDQDGRVILNDPFDTGGHR